MYACITSAILPPFTPKSWVGFKEVLNYTIRAVEKMKKENQKRDQWLHIRLFEEEKKAIEMAFKKTTHAKMSDYARGILLGKPMIAAIRNQSLQEILAVLVKLRNDLNGVANNYNQTVHKLHTIDHIPEFKTWVLNYEKDRVQLLKDIEAIKNIINQTAEKWLQS